MAFRKKRSRRALSSTATHWSIVISSLRRSISGESGSGIPKDHLWTTGNSGEGVELRGTLKGEIQSCYEFFDWCTWDTEPKKHCCCNDDQCYHSCVESSV